MLSRWLVRLYPPRWRERYGEELDALLENGPITPAVLFDVLRGAAGAHTASLSIGGLRMRSHALTLTSLVALVLVLPAVTFLAAAMVRGMQPAAYEPARTATAVFDAFAHLPQDWNRVLVVLAPLVAAVLSVVTIARRLSTSEQARADVAALGTALARIARQPAIVAGAVALVASFAVLAFAVVHAIAG